MLLQTIRLHTTCVAKLVLPTASYVIGVHVRSATDPLIFLQLFKERVVIITRLFFFSNTSLKNLLETL